MAAHSSIFAWRIPWTEEPRGLQSMGLQNLDSVLKSRDITLPAKVRIVKAMVFPVIAYKLVLSNKIFIEYVSQLSCVHTCSTNE